MTDTDRSETSIVIPTLNEHRYIGRLLGCLNRQTCQEFETIIVDASTNNDTRTAIQEHKGNLDVKYIPTDKANVALQRNIGVKDAKHERILFLDADCMFGKEFIHKITRSEMELGTVKYKFYDSHFLISGFLGSINIIKKATASIHPISMGFCLVSTKNLHNRIGGFDKNIKFASDLDYVKRAGKVGRFTVDHSITVHTSARRFNKEGNRRTFKRWIQAYVLSLRKDGLQKNSSVDYKFGRHTDD